MDKRGFLFTIISLIMLISILAFVIAYRKYSMYKSRHIK